MEDTAQLLGWDTRSGADRRIVSFEIEQARQRGKLNRRNIFGTAFSECGWVHLFLTVSVIANFLGLLVLVKLQDGSISSKNILQNHWATAGSNHSNIIYGHVHVAKTAGTEINGILAARYDHVCGNKGYSLDYFEYNERVRNSTNHDVRYVDPDSISNRSQDATVNRGRVPWDIVEEIGFQDCDFISLENSWEIWPKIRRLIPAKFKMELHVPCLNPLEHLMSMCHYKDLEFDCRGDDLEAEIEACVFGMDRFSLQLENLPDIDLKCFASIPIGSYIDYMGQRLESRRIPAKYVHRESNGAGGARDAASKRHECLGWYPDVADQVQELLLEKYDYYQWCDECLGLSESDLLSETEHFLT